MKTIEITQTKFREAQKYFTDEINKIISEDVDEILTNGNLASVILDSMGYSLDNNTTLEKDENGKAKKYPMGTISGKQLLVDPYMRWDDNRILLKDKDENIINEIKIIDENDMLI